MKFGLGLNLTRQRILGSDFSPSDISNLDIWYDFSTITADNDTAVSSFSNYDSAPRYHGTPSGLRVIIPGVNVSDKAC